MFLKLFKSKKSSAQSQKDKARRRIKHQQDKKNRTEKIPVSQLRIGMFVRELDIPWEESSFMFQGIELKTQDEILQVQQQCKHVWVDYTEYCLDSGKPNNAANPFKPVQPSILVEEEYNDAKLVHTQTKHIITNVFEDIRLGGEIDVGKVKQSINNSVSSILRNPDASIWLTRLQEKDNNTAQHSLNVAALSVIAGRSLGFSRTELENLGVCALLHDIGKAQLPRELSHKCDNLSEREEALLRKHAEIGFQLLSSSKNIYSGAAQVALTHHERVDGQGYPRGTGADDIPQYAKIVAIADAYDSMTSRNMNSRAMSPTESLDILYSERGKRFDEKLVLKFIEGIGIYPPGSIVEMTNGEVGIVLSTTDERLQPRVILMLDENKDATVQQVVDLSLMNLDTLGKPYQIKTTLHDGAFGIIVEEFQRAGLRIGD